MKKIASALALLIGAMSVFAGSKVLLGIDTKDYNILSWLVYYNVIFGLLSIITAYLIWSAKEKRKAFILFILSMHFIVFIYLQFFSDVAASESIKAMIFRTSIWVLIAVLTILIPSLLSKQKK